MKNWFKTYYGADHDAVIMKESNDEDKLVVYLQFKDFNLKVTLSEFKSEAALNEGFDALDDEKIEELIKGLIDQLPIKI